MNRKRFFACILSLIMVLASGNAFAAGGNLVLRSVDYTQDGNPAYFDQFMVSDDTLYLPAGDYGLFTWQRGDTGLNLIPWKDGEHPYSQIYNMLGYDCSPSICAEFVRNGDIYIVVAVSESDPETYDYNYTEAFLYKMVLQDGAVSVEGPIGNIDWSGLLSYYENSSYANNLDNAIVIGDDLYGTFYSDNGPEFVRVPLNGDRATVFGNVGEVSCLFRTEDGSLIASMYEYGEEAQAIFVHLDPETGSTQEIARLAFDGYSYPSGMAYCAETGEVFYVLGGKVVALDLDTMKSRDICEYPLNYGDRAVVLGSDLYITGNFETLMIIDLNAEKPERSLMISNGGSQAERAYYRFSNTHADVSVGISNVYYDDSRIIEDMMNRLDTVDIYTVSVGSQAYKVLYERGYLAPVQSEKIDNFVREMYPAFSDRLMINGETVAMPIETYSSCFGINTSALQDSGLTIEDFPTNWLELIRSIPDLQERMAERGGSLFGTDFTQPGLRYSLISSVLSTYIAEQEQAGGLRSFNEKELLDVLQALDQLDMDALGIPAEYNYDDATSVAVMETEYIQPVFSFYSTANTSYTESKWNAHPLLMGLTPSSNAVLPVSGAVAIINPFSKNVDIASEFLEYMMDEIAPTTIADLCPGRSEPVRSEYYESSKKDAEEYVAAVEEMLANAAPEDVQMLEEELKNAQQWLEEVEDIYWDVSPKGLEWYRANDEHIAFNVYNLLVYSSEQSSADIAALLDQYVQRTLSAEDLLRKIDQKVQMMLMEGY